MYAAGVDSIGRVESFFDAISYQKGGSVIRMMRAYLNSRRIGEEQYGLRRSLLQVCRPADLLVHAMPCCIVLLHLQISVELSTSCCSLQDNIINTFIGTTSSTPSYQACQ